MNPILRFEKEATGPAPEEDRIIPIMRTDGLRAECPEARRGWPIPPCPPQARREARADRMIGGAWEERRARRGGRRRRFLASTTCLAFLPALLGGCAPTGTADTAAASVRHPRIDIRDEAFPTDLVQVAARPGPPGAAREPRTSSTPATGVADPRSDVPRANRDIIDRRTLALLDALLTPAPLPPLFVPSPSLPPTPTESSPLLRLLQE